MSWNRLEIKILMTLNFVKQLSGWSVIRFESKPMGKDIYKDARNRLDSINTKIEKKVIERRDIANKLDETDRELVLLRDMRVKYEKEVDRLGS